MDWLGDRAWQQVIAILVVLAGAGLIYRGADGASLDATALTGIVLFALGIAAPLVAQALRAYREDTARDEDG